LPENGQRVGCSAARYPLGLFKAPSRGFKNPAFGTATYPGTFLQNYIFSKELSKVKQFHRFAPILRKKVTIFTKNYNAVALPL
jgi:hypothetical protein